MENIIFYWESRYTTQTSNNIQAQMSIRSRIQNLTWLDWAVDLTHRHNLQLHGLNTYFWRTVANIVSWVKIDGFVNILAVSVKESRNQIDNIQITNALIDHRESNLS